MNTPITRAEHEEFCKRMEEEHHRIHHRLKKVEEDQKQITDLAFSVKELAMSVKANTEIQKDHEERLDAIEDRDGEMWRTVTKYAITCIIGIVIGYIFQHFGM